MDLHPAIEYLKYIWNARGRHGTHSPFVYALADQGLTGDAPLKDKLLNYFGEDRLVFMGDDGSKWYSYLDKRPADKILVAECIHRTKDNTQYWNALCKHSAVKTSIDIFRFGLLVFNEEFKEKQHFVLKGKT